MKTTVQCHFFAMRSGSADLVGPALTGRGHTDISTQLGEALLTRVSSADVVDGVVTRVYFSTGAPLSLRQQRKRGGMSYA